MVGSVVRGGAVVKLPLYVGEQRARTQPQHVLVQPRIAQLLLDEDEERERLCNICNTLHTSASE